MILYLLETLSPDINFDDGKIIALTPEVCYSLDKKGLEYSIIEDYFDAHTLFEDRLFFMEDQSKQLHKLDCFIKDKIPQLSKFNLDLATLYSFRLKTSIDPVIFKSRALMILFEKLQPQEVIFVKYPGNKKRENNFTSLNNGSLFSRLVPLICHKKNISTRQIIGEKSQKNESSDSYSKQKISSVMNIIYKIGSFLPVFLSIRKKNRCLNIFQTNIAYSGFNTFKGIIKEGHNAYLLKGNRIYSLSRFRLKISNLSKFESSRTAVSIKEWEHLSQNIYGSELLSWVNDKCQLDVSDIILPDLEHFVAKICPEILGKYVFFVSFFQKESIDALVSPFMQGPSELAAIAAARSLNNTKSFCVEHGDDIFKNIFFRMEELTFFDHVITSNKEHKQYLDLLCKRNGLESKVHVCQHRLSPLQSFKPKKTPSENSKTNHVLFLPTFFVGDSLRIDCDVHLSPTAYYKFQKKILFYFSTKKEYHFIWKGLLGAESISNPIPYIIDNENISNVVFESKPFTSYLKDASRVLFDYPSTGLYESTFVGIPTMSLCDTKLNIRLQAIENFGHNVSVFSGTEEAISKIDEFLVSSPNDYILERELDDVDLIDLIESEFKDGSYP